VLGDAENVPAGHEPHVLAFVGLYVPALQLLHAEAPDEALMEPDMHARHDVELAAGLKKPGEQDWHWVAEAEELKFPGWQAAQVTVASLVKYPGRQAVHWDALEGDHDPGAHGEHDEAETPLKVPARQLLQATEALAVEVPAVHTVHAVAWLPLKLPLAQGLHGTAVLLEKVPAWQVVQIVAPTGLKAPAEQLAQKLLATPLLVVPAGHCRHAVEEEGAKDPPPQLTHAE
jgi:hypothetical protein